MSAPTAFDAGALVSGLAWSVRPHPEAEEQTEAYQGDDRRSRARIAALTRAYNALCTQVVDAYEIAAGLEAAGISDRRARQEYGAASVFELAEAMYALVPRRPQLEGAWVDPWQRPVSRHLLRGLLYALPGLLYAMALMMLNNGFDAVLLLSATIVASGLGQGLSLLGHVLMGRHQNAAAMALFRTALVGGGALGALCLAVSWLAGWLSPAVVLAACQFAYLLAAIVLMVLDANLLLLAVLTPAVVFAIGELSGATHLPTPVKATVLALCVATAVVAAWTRSKVSGKEVLNQARHGFGLSRTDGTAAIGYTLYGLVTASLIAFSVVDVISRGRDTSAGSIALMMAPLVASLGIAEWLVYRVRSRALALLQATSTVEEFRAVARAEVAKTIGSYAAVLAALTGLVVFVFPHGAAPPFVLSVCAYGVLGLVLFCGTILLSLGRHWLALGLTGAALAVDSTMRMLIAPASPESLAAMHFVVFMCLLGIMVVALGYRYTRAGAHR